MAWKWELELSDVETKGNNNRLGNTFLKFLQVTDLRKDLAGGRLFQSLAVLEWKAVNDIIIIHKYEHSQCDASIWTMR